MKFGALIVETGSPSFSPRHGGKKIKEFARQFPSQVDLSVRFLLNRIMPEKFSVFAKNGMVVSSQPLATLAGVRVLMEGGNAIDAAVATAAVLEWWSRVLSASAATRLRFSIPPGDKTLKGAGCQRSLAVRSEFRLLPQERFQEMPQRGIHSVTVPGAVHGWSALLDALRNHAAG